MNNIEYIFNKGLIAFNNQDFYSAHEFWEEIWIEHRLPDAQFVQGMIQLSVGFYHLTNQNLNGARGLFKKCKNKLENYNGIQRGLSVDSLKILLNNAYKEVIEIKACDDFNWSIFHPLSIEE